MRIAILARVLFLSGVTTHIIDLSRELIKMGNQVYVFTSGPEIPGSQANIDLVERLKSLGVIVVIINFPNSSSNKFHYAIKMLKSVPRVSRKLKELQIDLIHV